MIRSDIYFFNAPSTECRQSVMRSPQIEESSDVSPAAQLGNGVRIWHLAQVREDAVIGDGCIIGRGAYVGSGVQIGQNCKIQNYALVYEPAILEDGVFVGPAAVLTNDTYPRAINSDGSLKSGHDWKPVGVTIRHGASIGARAVCVAPIEIGAWAMIGAGSTVVDDVPAYALMVGVPARRIGWVSPLGHKLELKSHGVWQCPTSKKIFKEISPNEIREEISNDPCS